MGEGLIDFVPAEPGKAIRDVDSFLPAVGGAPCNVCAAYKTEPRTCFRGNIRALSCFCKPFLQYQRDKKGRNPFVSVLRGSRTGKQIKSLTNNRKLHTL